MISFGLAIKLKKADLNWEPEDGDIYYFKHKNKVGVWCDGCHHERWTDDEMAQSKDFVFAPSLSQLLAEIEKKAYWWELIDARKLWPNGDGYHISIFDWKHETMVGNLVYGSKYDPTPEEAAGQALLWILEQEAGAKDKCDKCGQDLQYVCDTCIPLFRFFKCSVCGNVEILEKQKSALVKAAKYQPEITE